MTTTAAPMHSPSASVLSSLESSRYELTLGDYWRVLLKRKWVIFVTFLAVLTGTIMYTNAQLPVYSAVSAVRVSQNVGKFMGMEASMLYSTSNFMANYESSITSQKVLERVVVRLGLLSPKDKKNDLLEKVEAIRDAITTRQIGNTDIISINVRYSDPRVCAAIANQTAEAFVEVDMLDKTKQARTIRQFAERQLEFFEKKLAVTEEKIRNFRQQGKALGVAIGLENRLSELERERNGLLKQYTEKHPDIQKVDEMISGIRKKIQELPRSELELARLQRDLEINDRAYRTMKEKFEHARLSEAETVSEVSVVETATVPKSPIFPKKNLNKLLGAVVGIFIGIVLAFGLDSLDTSIGTIEDVERTIRLPVLGVVPFYDPLEQDHAWWRLDQHLFYFLKRNMDAVPGSASLIMNQDTFSTLAESYRILRTFIEFTLERKPGEPGKVIEITSTGPQEGKSLTACNLAISLAHAGRRTLLIDADLRRPVIHRLFGLKRMPGLSDILLHLSSFDGARCSMGDILVGESSHWDRVVSMKMIDRLEIITTGRATENPAELLASDAMKTLLTEMRQKYDYIILDTPPVLPVTDARTLGMLSDVTFFIYRAGRTARRSLIRAREELDLAGVKVKGIILNHANPEAQLTNREYYRYYGEIRKSQTALRAAEKKTR